MKKFTLILLTAFLALFANGQIKKNVLNLPEVPGYKLLKCDFHMHRVFSDGDVWPTARVDEAFAEGLDAIAISDHLENQRNMTEVGAELNHNTS